MYRIKKTKAVTNGNFSFVTAFLRTGIELEIIYCTISDFLLVRTNSHTPLGISSAKQISSSKWIYSIDRGI